MYSLNGVLQLCIHLFKCKNVPILKFRVQMIKLSAFRNCTLYKYIRIPFLIVVYIRKYCSPIHIQKHRYRMKVKHDFPNGKSRGYLRINGQFFANKRFSKGGFDDNSLNIGQLDVFFTFVFWFNLEKMP